MLLVENGQVTKEEFISFYNDMNINFNHNDIFRRFVGTQWHYTSHKIQEVNEEEIRKCLIALKSKLIEKTQGSKD